MVEEEEISEWAELPTCLLEVVSDRFITNGDYARFGTVCNSWRLVFLDNVGSRPPHPHPPLLMIPFVHDNFVDDSCNVGMTMTSTSISDCYSECKEEKPEEERQGEEVVYCKKVTSCKYKRSLYSMIEQKVYKFSVPVPDNVYCFGSSHGWLTTVAMNDDSYPVRLLNPFLPIDNNEIELPSLRAMPVESSTPLAHYAYADKFVVSSDPAAAAAIGTTTSDHYTVMAISGKCQELLAWKPGDEAWTPVEMEDKLCILDFIHYKDGFYAVTWRGEFVVTVDNNSRAVFYAPPQPDTQYYTRRYTVDNNSRAVFYAPPPPDTQCTALRVLQTIITKACKELGVKPVASKRCLSLFLWLEERYETVYMRHPGFQKGSKPLLSLDNPFPMELPENLFGEKWAFVQLPLSAVQEVSSLATKFGGSLDLDLLGFDIDDKTLIPGLSVATSRAKPLAAWMNGLEVCSVEADTARACLILSVGISTRYVYATYNKTATTTKESEAWEAAKKACGGLHFLAIQESLDSDDCVGFWLLLELPPPPV